MAKCDYCGTDIAPEQFTTGEAATILRRNYCVKCTQEAIRRSKQEEYLPDFRTPRPAELHPRPKRK